jgi:hypothetical protein
MRALLDDGRVLDTPSYAAAQRDAVRRDLAEHARLAYVAATRARDAMVFVGDRSPPKGGMTDTFLRTTAAVLATLAAEGGARHTPALVSLHADFAFVGRASSSKAKPTILARPRALGVRSSRSVDVTATELVNFVLCPRRFELAHVTRLKEPNPPRVPARETRGIEGQSAYARRIAREEPAIRRGRRFLARASAKSGATVSVEGAIDLWIAWPDGRADALILTLERSSLTCPHADLTADLAAFAHAARPEVRTGTFRGLEGGSEDPVWRGAIHASKMNERLLGWGASLVEARWFQSFPRAPLSTCYAIGCGYVQLCHPGEVHGET